MEGEALIVAHYEGGWCVLRLAQNNKTLFVVVSGPHSDHADAVQAAETRAYRLAQGWAP